MKLASALVVKQLKEKLKDGLNEAEALEVELAKVEVKITRDNFEMIFKGTGEPVAFNTNSSIMFKATRDEILDMMKEGHTRCRELRDEHVKRFVKTVNKEGKS